MADFNSDNQKTDAALHGLAEQAAGKADAAALAAAASRVTALEDGKADKTALSAEQTARQNADNAEKAAREAAVAALRNENCWVKLKEMTVEPVNSASMDLSGIDWDQYWQVVLVGTTAGQTEYSNNGLNMRFNNRTDNIYSSGSSTGSYITLNRTSVPTYLQVHFYDPGASLAGHIVRSGSFTPETFYVQPLRLRQLTSIQFYWEGNSSFIAGGAFAIYGLKK